MTNTLAGAGIKKAGLTINIQWQVLQCGDQHRNPPMHAYAHTQTQGLRCFWDLLTHLPCTVCLAVSLANSTQHAHIQTKYKNTHSCRFRAGLELTRAHMHECKPYTQWHYYPLALNAKMCTGKWCVYLLHLCWQMRCLKLTPPTLSQWQQVSSQGPDLCELTR